jgi:hypothetical protein
MVGSVGPGVNNLGRSIPSPGMYPVNGVNQANLYNMNQANLYNMNQAAMMNYNAGFSNQAIMMNYNAMPPPSYNNIHNVNNQVYPTQVVPGPEASNSYNVETNSELTQTSANQK